jgi:hypothetical protein
VGITSVGTRYALIGVRQALAARNVVIDFAAADILAGSADNLLIELYFGGTTATAPTFNPLAFSNMEVFDANDLAGPADRVHSGGVKTASYYIAGNSSTTQVIRTSRRLGSYINGTLEEAYVCATPLTSNANAAAAINWTEFI